MVGCGILMWKEVGSVEVLCNFSMDFLKFLLKIEALTKENQSRSKKKDQILNFRL